jgi:hypothetical protein
MYLYETHCHSSQCSACAKSPSAELVRAYKAAGYAGLVLTDHFIRGNTSVDRTLPWPERMQAYYDAYLEAKAEGDALDFDVIFGIEHAYGSGKEVLIYGIDLEFLLKNDDIRSLSLAELADRVRAYGGLVIMAHPYRDRDYVDMSVQPQEEVLDGVELFNAFDAPGEDLRTFELAQRHPEYILTSGGDVHRAECPKIGAAGLWFPHRIRDGKELVAALKAKDYRFQVDRQQLGQVEAKHLGG